MGECNALSWPAYAGRFLAKIKLLRFPPAPIPKTKPIKEPFFAPFVSFSMLSPALPVIIKKVTVTDKMQKRYTYNITEPEGKNFHPDFKPQLTPADMLELGVFGGRYMTDCVKEFPSAWFKKAKLYKGSSPTGDKDLNYFKVAASQPLSVWKKKGWIHPQDPRGWFQWYCRYYMGRRSDDDQRQIGRWKAMVRHIAQIKKGCKPGDTTCRRKQRQALLHWAYDSLNL